jgi:hypothetical protein
LKGAQTRDGRCCRSKAITRSNSRATSRPEHLDARFVVHQAREIGQRALVGYFIGLSKRFADPYKVHISKNPSDDSLPPYVVVSRRVLTWSLIENVWRDCREVLELLIANCSRL